MASRNDWFSKHKAIEMIIATKNISARVRVTRARDRAREREREKAIVSYFDTMFIIRLARTRTVTMCLHFIDFRRKIEA